MTESPTPWTPETLRALIQELVEANDRLLDERNLRYQQRFEAQTAAIDTAHQTAISASKMASDTFALKEDMAAMSGRVEALDRLTDAKFVTFRTLIDSQAEKVALALASSDKAVTKAEAATEKRFEGVNEFREQLRDQANTFISRAEVEQRIHVVDDKAVDAASRLSDLRAEVNRERNMYVSRDAVEQMTAARAVETKAIREAALVADAKLDERIKRLETGSANLQGRLWALGAGIAIIVVLVNIAIAVVTKIG